MSTFDVSVILRLVDQLTGPSRRAGAAMTGFQRTMHNAMSAVNKFRGGTAGFERPFVAGVGRMTRALNEFQIRARKAFSDIGAGPGAKLGQISGKLNEMRYQMATTAFFTAPLAFPFKAFADYEMALIRLGQIAQDPKDEFQERLQDRSEFIRRIARETGQYANDLTAVYTSMVASGVPEPEARVLMPGLGRMMTATGTNAEDTGKLAFGLNKAFGIKSYEDQMETMAAFIVAGKKGAFELRDAAQYVPVLGSNMAMLGMGGKGGAKDLAAFLQVTREGAGDPAEAATNLRNMFQKLTQKETRKNFNDALNIDLAKVLNDAQKNGESPLLKFVEFMRKYVEEVKDGNKYYMGDLVADMQALSGANAFLNKPTAELQKLIKDVHGATEAEITKDFETGLNSLTYSYRLMMIALSDLNRVLVGPLSGAARDVLADIASITDSVRGFAVANPELTASILKWGAAFIAASLGLRVLIFLFNSFRMAALALYTGVRAIVALLDAFKAFNGVGGVLRGAFAALSMPGLLAGAGLAAVAARVGVLGAAFRALGMGITMALGPWGLLAGALLFLVPEGWWTKAGDLLTQGWTTLKGIVQSGVDAIKGALSSVGGALDGIFNNASITSPGAGIAPRPQAPSISSTMEGFMPQSTEKNVTVQAPVSQTITINATLTDTTPGAIGAAVQGGGQSVGAEIRKSMGDGGD